MEAEVVDLAVYFNIYVYLLTWLPKTVVHMFFRA